MLLPAKTIDEGIASEKNELYLIVLSRRSDKYSLGLLQDLEIKLPKN